MRCQQSPFGDYDRDSTNSPYSSTADAPSWSQSIDGGWVALFYSRQPPHAVIRSSEHETTLTPSLGAHIAQAKWETSADRIEFMDSTLKTLKAALEAIRDVAASALNQVAPPKEECSMRWKYKACQYIKHFTKVVPLEAAGRCPRCKKHRVQTYSVRSNKIRSEAVRART